VLLFSHICNKFTIVLNSSFFYIIVDSNVDFLVLKIEIILKLKIK
jgi:hypothetical protein